MKDEASFSTATPYTKVPDHDDSEDLELTAVEAVSLAGLYVDKPVKSVHPKYNANLSRELQQLTWTDTYFDECEDDADDIVAVFDFDYQAMEEYYTSVGWVGLVATILYTPLFVLSLIGLAPCYLRKNVQWMTRSQHVAITRDGIKFVRERRPCCWGMSCTDQGKSTKTVPFDKITDCNVEEPAGNTCFCITNVLSVVNVDTASSGTDGRKELRLAGLKDPHGFKKLVWAMKRQQQQPFGGGYVTENSGITAPNQTPEDVTSLLKEIRDELRTHNQLLKSLPNNTRSTVATVPAEATAVTEPSAPEESEIV